MLLECPDLHEMVSAEWDAYTVLDRGRQWGYAGPQSILLSEIVAFCTLNDVSDHKQLIKYVQTMDSDYLHWYAAKQEAKRGKKGSG